MGSVAPALKLKYPAGMNDAQPNFSDICTACGLCCDGTLFGHALLEPDEIDAAVSSGFTLKEFSGTPGFSQPCQQLCGTRCGIYAARPKICHDYRCIMLNRIGAGKIEMDDALRHVAQVRTAVADLYAELLPGESIGKAKERMQKAIEQASDIEASPRFRLMLGVVELLLDKYFRTKGQRVFGRMSS